MRMPGVVAAILLLVHQSAADCGAGYESGWLGQCHKCAPGRSSDAGGECEECSPGSVTADWGSTACHDCPGGSYSASTTECRACPVGTYSDTFLLGERRCKPCRPGWTNNLPGQKQCMQCPNGKYSANELECKECPPGTISDKLGHKSKGFLSGISAISDAMEDAGGNTACSQCPADRPLTSDHIHCHAAAQAGASPSVKLAEESAPPAEIPILVLFVVVSMALPCVAAYAMYSYQLRSCKWLVEQKDTLWKFPLYAHLLWDLFDVVTYSWWSASAIRASHDLSLMAPLFGIAAVSLIVPLYAQTHDLTYEAYTKFEMVVDVLQMLSANWIALHDIAMFNGMVLLSDVTSSVDLFIIKGPDYVKKIFEKSGKEVLCNLDGESESESEGESKSAA
mmetsp:Transcript_41324/g.119589  ORF Transcript_41324/g.119589 Transcript_41324/m.119589 type:complete len:394 (+) Transcript_41324:79-1260(+)